jgi:long-subunit fatty acid transport protein
VRLPSTGFFEGARIEGDQADMEMVIPAMFRAGVEARPHPRVRAELAFGWEMWSQHESIDIVPDGIRIEDQPAVGIYELGPLEIPRNLEDTFSLALGLEAQPMARVPLLVRLGYTFETGAATDEYLSLITPDSDKHLISAGLGYRVGNLRFDAMFSHAMLADRDVSLAESCVPLQNPIRTGQGEAIPPCEHFAEPDPQHVYVGAGTYESSYTVVGVGMNAEF